MTVDAIEWAVDHDMDVINMSLGSPFGSADDPAAVAPTNAAKDGVIVVASAGNAGPNPYIDRLARHGHGALSVAADDPTQCFPGANLALSDRHDGSTAIDANGVAVASGTTFPVKVCSNPDGTISLGCNPAEYSRAPASPASSSSSRAARALAWRGRSSASRPEPPR